MMCIKSFGKIMINSTIATIKKIALTLIEPTKNYSRGLHVATAKLKDFSHTCERNAKRCPVARKQRVKHYIRIILVKEVNDVVP